MPAGRPSSYSRELADEICVRISTSTDSLKTICEADDMPSALTIYRWLANNPEFNSQYARAKEQQTAVMAEEILELADTPRIGQKVKSEAGPVDSEGNPGEIRVTEIMTADMIDHRKLQIESRKWLMGKLRPKVYGDKLQTEHSGSITMNPGDAIRAKRLARLKGE